MAELALLTRQGKPLPARHDLLRKMFPQHYDAPRVEFLLNLLCSDDIVGGAKLNKSQAIEILVEQNAPFYSLWLPFCASQAGIKEVQGKRAPAPAIDWTSSSAACLMTAPFNSIRPSSSSEDDSEKMANALSHWQDAIVIHNKHAPKKDKLSLSDHDKLSGSQVLV